MAQPGWYPDPSGLPQTYRYWDGAQWSEVTTTDPSTPPPGAPTPPPPPPGPPAPAAPTQVGGWAGVQAPDQAGSGYGDIPPPTSPGMGGGFAAGMSPMPATSGGATGTGGGGGKVALIAVAVVVVLLLLGVGGFFGIRALAGDDDKDTNRASDEETSQSDDDEPSEEDSDEPSDDPTITLPPPSSSAPATASCTSGSSAVTDDQAGKKRLTGGGISMPRIDGYSVESDPATGEPWMSPLFTWGNDVIAQEMVIESNDTSGWISMYAVGGVSTGWGTPEEAARAVMECMAPNPRFYSGYTGHDEVFSAAVDVEGADAAWSYVADIHVDDPDLQVTGDRAQVIVVDTGDPETYGMYISVVPLGDTAMYGEQEQFAAQLRVE